MPRKNSRRNNKKRISSLSKKKRVIKGGTQVPSLSEQLGIPECACCTIEKCKSWYPDDMPELGYNISQYSDENNSLAEQFLGGTNEDATATKSNVLSSAVAPVSASAVAPVSASAVAPVSPSIPAQVLPNTVSQLENTPISSMVPASYSNSNTQNLTNKLESESSKDESGFLGNLFKNIFGGGKKKISKKKKRSNRKKRKNKSLKKK